MNKCKLDATTANEPQHESPTPTINDLPLMCVESILESAAAVHDNPLELRCVCKLWQRVLLNVYHLHIHVDENEPVRFRVRPLIYSFAEKSGKPLSVTQLQTSSLIGHVCLAELSTNGIEKGALTLLNDAAQRLDHVIDVNVDIKLWDFVVDNYGEWWTENDVAPSPEQIDERTFIRNFDVENALDQLFHCSQLSGRNFSEVFPALRFKSVRFSDVAFDYNATNGRLRRHILRFLATGGEARLSVSLCNKQYYEWLSELAESLPMITELKVSRIRMTTRGPRDGSKRETFEKIRHHFPAIRRLDFEPQNATDSLSWIAELPHLQSVRLMLSSETHSWKNQNVFPTILPSHVRRFHLLTAHSFGSASSRAEPTISVRVIEACLRMASNVAEMQLDLYAHVNAFSDFLSRLLERTRVNAFGNLETLRVSGWIENAQLTHLLGALNSACPKIATLGLRFPQKASDERCTSTLFGDYRYLEILRDLLKSLRRFDVYDGMVKCTKVPNGILLPETSVICAWLLDMVRCIREIDGGSLERVAFEFPYLRYEQIVGSTEAWAMNLCDVLLDESRRREGISDADLHAVGMQDGRPWAGCRLEVLFLPGVAEFERPFRCQLHLAFGYQYEKSLSGSYANL